mgnify:FL=1
MAVSVALHAVLGLTFRVQGRLPPRPEPDSRLIVVVPRTVPQAVDMPYDPGRPGPVAPRESGLRPVTQPTALPVPRPVVVTSETRPLALPDSVPLAPVAGAPAGDGRGGLRP